jgi:hypothetical protein
MEMDESKSYVQNVAERGGGGDEEEKKEKAKPKKRRKKLDWKVSHAGIENYIASSFGQ